MIKHITCVVILNKAMTQRKSYLLIVLAHAENIRVVRVGLTHHTLPVSEKKDCFTIPGRCGNGILPKEKGEK